MFELGIMTDQISMNFEESLKAINKLGLKNIEIHSLWNKNIEELNNEEIKEAKRLLKKYRLSVSNISSTAFLQCSVDNKDIKFSEINENFLTIKGDFSRHLNALKKCIMLSKEFQTNKIRIFGFRKVDNYDESKIIKTISDKLKKVAQVAEEAEIILLIENCPFTFLPTGWHVKKVIDKVSSDYLRPLWDPGNTLRSGKINVYPEDYDCVKRTIAHMHIKDVNIENTNMVTIGEGV